MFTGIVQEVGTVERAQRSRTIDRLTIYAPKTAARVAPGESIAINGACLTLVRAHEGHLLFEIITQTRRLTNLGAVVAGSRVNVELSLTLSDRLNGHLVLGHVDGLSTVADGRAWPPARRWRCGCRPPWVAFWCRKGRWRWMGSV